MTSPAGDRAARARASLATGLILVAAYVATLPSGLPDFDAGEFALLARTGQGAAHPPGYPWWVLLLRATALFSSDSLNLVPVRAGMGALLVACALAWLAWTLRGVTSSSWAAGLACVAVGLSPPVWRVATGMEPFTLHLLLVAGVVVAWHRDADAVTSAVLQGAALGLSLGNHHTMVLLLPFSLVDVARRRSARAFSAWVLSGVACGALSVGALAWMTADGAGWTWHDAPGTPQALADLLLRRGYGTFSLAGGVEAQPWRGTATMLTLGFRAAWPWLLLVLVTFPALPRPSRRAVVASVLCGPIFALLFNRGGNPLEDLLVERFAAMPLLLLAAPVALALDAVGLHVHRAPLWASACAVTMAVVALPHADRRGETLLEMHARNMVATVPPGGVVVTRGDHATWTALYAAQVLAPQPFHVLPLSLEDRRWTQERVAREVGVEWPAGTSVEAWLARVSSTGRGVFTSAPEADAWGSLAPRLYPLGPVFRLAPDEASLPSPAALWALHQRGWAHAWTLPAPPQLALAPPTMLLVLSPYRVGLDIMIGALDGDDADAARALRAAMEPAGP